MKLLRFALLLPIVLLMTGTGRAATPNLPPVERVDVVPGHGFSLNGRPFFPLMAWLQDAGNFPAVKDCGMNTVAGYWDGSSGTKDVVGYYALLEKAGLYGVLPFDARLKGKPNLFGYIQDDEPDLTSQVSDADVAAGPGMHINSSDPLWKILDGDRSSWSVLDPMLNASVTVTLKVPVTVVSLGISPTISPGLAVMKDVVFTGDGAEILRATVQNKAGEQKFPLAQAATFTTLKMTVLSTYPGTDVWGSVGEVAGYDAAGTDVLLSKPHPVPRATPADVKTLYDKMKAADTTRPVFLTVTSDFDPTDGGNAAQLKTTYGGYAQGCDAMGFDFYPIYGWNKPEWITRVYDEQVMLSADAGTRPTYQWIETSKGGQWTGDLANQKDVTPADIRAEVWMAICGGAQAIGYFTHVWKPAYAQFGVPDANRVALADINAQITRLTPAILGDPSKRTLTVETDGKVKVATLLREAPDGLYLFTVNDDARALGTTARFHLDGLKVGTIITVEDENRTLTAEDGVFADKYDPLAVHIYQLAK